MAGEMNNFRTGTQLRARTSRVPSSQSTGHARIRTRGKGATDTVTHPPARSTILVSFIFHCGQLFRAPTVPIGCPISSKPSRTTGSPLIPQQGSDKPTRPSRDACEPRGSTRFLRFFPTLLLYFPVVSSTLVSRVEISRFYYYYSLIVLSILFEKIQDIVNVSFVRRV